MRSPKPARNAPWCMTMLKKHCRKGTTVYVITLSVARSGMSRRIRMLVSPARGRIQDITGWVTGAGILPGDMDRGALVSGGGMDMHWHAVECLWHALGYPHATWSENSPLVKVSL